MSVTTYTNCLRIERTDGIVLCITELDKDLVINDQVLDGTWTSIDQTYLSAAGYTPTNFESTSDNAVNNADVEGVLSAVGVQREDIIGGRYDFAKLHIFIWDWTNDVLVKKLGSGHWGETTLKDGSYVAEFRSLSQQLQQTIGRTYNPECDEQLGGPRCTINVGELTSSFTTLSATNQVITIGGSLATVAKSDVVTTATSTKVFSSTGITEVDGTFDNAIIKFTSGADAGKESTIVSQVGSIITMSSAISFIVTDTFEIYEQNSAALPSVEIIDISQSLPTSVTSLTQFEDTALTAVDGTYAGLIVRFTSGLNIGEERTITTYTVGSIIVSSAFTNTILVTDLYDIYHIDSTNRKIGINSYAYGSLAFTSGLNDKLHMEIKKSTTNTFELFLPMPFEIKAGDTFTAYPGCDKRLVTCKDTFVNHINFQGFPFIPGIDQISKFGGQ